jgi:hypothetical protein
VVQRQIDAAGRALGVARARSSMPVAQPQERLV